MPSKPNEDHRARAEAKFKKKEPQAQEADEVWAERAAAEKATEQNATRLRSLRLAKQEAEMKAKAARKTPTKASRSKELLP